MVEEYSWKGIEPASANLLGDMDSQERDNSLAEDPSLGLHSQ